MRGAKAELAVAGRPMAFAYRRSIIVIAGAHGAAAGLLDLTTALRRRRTANLAFAHPRSREGRFDHPAKKQDDSQYSQCAASNHVSALL